MVLVAARNDQGGGKAPVPESFLRGGAGRDKEKQLKPHGADCIPPSAGQSPSPPPSGLG